MALKNITYFGQATNRTQLRENLILKLKDSFIGVGGYYNIESGVVGYDGEDLSELKPSVYPGESNFKFWRGLSNDWVWESGTQINFTGGSEPIVVSGIYIDNAFYPTGIGGQYEYYVDYLRGGIRFINTAITSGTSVRVNRSERASFVYPNESNEYRQLMMEHQRFFNEAPGSGVDSVPMHLKAFLPAVFVDIQMDRNRPYELGSSAMFKSFRVDLDIFAEDLRQFDFLRDACISLEGSTINLFDVNQVEQSGFYPLNYRGERNENPQSLSGLLDLFFWKKGKFSENIVERRNYTPYPLHSSTITHRFEIVG